MNELKLYSELLSDIKGRVRQGQIRANISANAEMLVTYWDVGKMIHQRIFRKKFGIYGSVL